jgi:ABC-type transport system involved in cytochrome bd biosynthesis fused ATPase/permease subunit
MSILPYIVEAINRDEKQVGSAAIGTFRTLLFESVENIKPFLKEVFPGLLKQAQQGYVFLLQVIVCTDFY